MEDFRWAAYRHYILWRFGKMGTGKPAPPVSIFLLGVHIHQLVGSIWVSNQVRQCYINLAIGIQDRPILFFLTQAIKLL